MSIECPMCGAMINGDECEYCGYVAKKPGTIKTVSKYISKSLKNDQDDNGEPFPKIKKDDVKEFLTDIINKI